MSKELKKRIGIVARIDDSGLGTMTLDFFRNIPVSKVLTIYSRYQNNEERFNGFDGVTVVPATRGVPTVSEIREFLKDLDVVVAFETPYNWNLFSEAKKLGIKTVLVVMYEWLPPKDAMPVEPDVYLCPSQLDYDLQWGNKVFLPTPVNRLTIPFIKRTQAKTFFFNNGHGGFSGRNSISELAQAISLVKSDVKFVIRSQVYVDSINDRRVRVEIGNVPDQSKLWSDGDVYIHLHKFDGLSLPLNEAMSAGVPTISLDFGPYASKLPKKLLVKPLTYSKITTIKPSDVALVNPVDVAAKIDEVAAMPQSEIESLSEEMNKLAEEISWSNLQDRYIEFFNSL